MTIKFNIVKDLVVTNKVVFLRCDLNVSIFEGKILDDTRIMESLETINYLIKNNAKIIIATHLGRPSGKKDIQYSTKIIAEYLNKFVKSKVYFVNDCIGEKVQNGIKTINYGEILVLENLRFYKEEEACDLTFAKNLSEGMNIYINEAFSCSHRAHASIFGVPLFIRPCAGFRFAKEVEYLSKVFRDIPTPSIAIVGGSKISTKINILKNLSSKLNYLVPAGGILNSFLKAEGFEIGKSLAEDGVKEIVLEIKEFAKQNNCQILMPKTVVTAKDKNSPNVEVKKINEIEKDDCIFDMDLKFINEDLKNIISISKICLWNGPVGYFEVKPFDKGCAQVANIISFYTKNKTLTSIIGGGDVIAAVAKNNNNLEDFSFVSTAGGAFLEFIEGKVLPGIEILKKSYDVL